VHFFRGPYGRALFDFQSAGASLSGLECGFVRNRVEPGGQVTAGRSRSGLVGEDNERGLEGVLGVLCVVEHPPTNREHHGAVAPNQHFERRFVAARAEVLQQLGIRR
jgi:hypothetical protein